VDHYEPTRRLGGDVVLPSGQRQSCRRMERPEWARNGAVAGGVNLAALALIQVVRGQRGLLRRAHSPTPVRG